MNELPDEDKTLKQEQEKAGEEQFTEGVLEEQSSEEVIGSEDAAPEMDIGMETGPDPEVTKEKESKMEIESDGTVRDEAVSLETKTEASSEIKKETSSEKKPGKSKKRKKKTAKDYAIEFFIKVGITALAVAALLIFVVGIHVNHGNSAYPMIKDGDLVITYKLDKGQNGVEIAYKFNGKVKFGRIVAKEGDTVDITDQGLLVNGYGILEDVVYPTTSSGAAISFPYIVPKGTVFVLNDYRSDAGDSRTYGAIPLSDVEGEVVLILRRRGI